MSPLELLDEKRDEIAAICQRFAVKRLRVFGSALTSSWDETRSDFDFLVEYGPGYAQLAPFDRLVGLKSAFEDLLDRPVDIVNVAFTKNPYFLENALSCCQSIYEA
jgi:predicted nucleotidyltransferase